ncbi:MAG: hypothetical protein R3342_05780 [Lutibacter sp.]|uniref:hypothetical protein n=1 Tax=Lutibacter sp. TaxID=1925666 RepID=UPI00299E6875|nr:hypothetical protein [Lutibacter sp.]MDX1829039.1 hypothetical protein [Lutibacter sp.]
MRYFLILLFTFIGLDGLDEDNLNNSLKYTNQENAIIEIANELKSIKSSYKTNKNYDNRFQKTKNIKLLAFSIEEAYLKAKPLIEAHYAYLKSKNRYGLANDKCLSAKKMISGTTAFESPIFELITNIKNSATKIIQNTKDNSWTYSFFNLQSYQKKLLEKNNNLQQLLKKTLELQRIDATRTESERIKIRKLKEVEQRIE